MHGPLALVTPAAAIVRAGRAIAAGAVVVALVAGCRSLPPPGPHAVRYRLAWLTDGIVRSTDTGAWEVTNDLGYRVRVTRGWVASYSMELVECPKEAGFGERVRAALSVDQAWAGHLSGTPNPAAIRPMQVESLLDASARDVGSVTLAPQPYCRLHYLVARAGHDSPGLPSELDMVDVSLHVDGSYRAPDAESDTPFTIHTASAYGQLFERAGTPPAAIRVDPGHGALEVEVRRRLARMFDGVDFAHMTDKAAALQMLKSLVDHAEIEIRTVDAKS